MPDEHQHTITFRAMGCQMAAHLDSRAPAASAVLEQVPGWFEAWEQCLSRFRLDSELSHLNAHTGQAVPVSPILWEVVRLALRVARQSEERVVPTVLTALERAGYDRSFDLIEVGGAALPSAMDSLVATPPEDWRAIRGHAGTRTLHLPAGVRLDLGGVAKGWAAARAARGLGAWGPALVDAGGDVAVSGPRAGGLGWPVGVANPYGRDELLAVLNVTRGGVATSGRDYRRWQQGGVAQHHLIDAHTGRPAQTDVLSATVVAPELWQAEMAAKVVVLSGAEAGLAWLEARPHLAGLICGESGSEAILTSRRLSDYVWR